jgi:hypothetical protein
VTVTKTLQQEIDDLLLREFAEEALDEEFHLALEEARASVVVEEMEEDEDEGFEPERVQEPLRPASWMQSLWPPSLSPLSSVLRDGISYFRDTEGPPTPPVVVRHEVTERAPGWGGVYGLTREDVGLGPWDEVISPGQSPLPMFCDHLVAQGARALDAMRAHFLARAGSDPQAVYSLAADFSVLRRLATLHDFTSNLSARGSDGSWARQFLASIRKDPQFRAWDQARVRAYRATDRGRLQTKVYEASPARLARETDPARGEAKRVRERKRYAKKKAAKPKSP